MENTCILLLLSKSFIQGQGSGVGGRAPRLPGSSLLAFKPPVPSPSVLAVRFWAGLNLLVPWFPHLQNWYNNRIYYAGYL